MRIWRDGETSRTLCPTCMKKTPVVFQRRTVTQSTPAISVDDVLVAVCTICDGIAMIPNQSMPRLREAIQKPKETLNVRIPAHLDDVLHLLIDQIAHGWKNGTSPVLKFLLHEFGNNVSYARRVREALAGELAQGSVDMDVSVRVPTYILIAVDQMAEVVGIENRSEVVRGILAAAKKDILEDGDPELAEQMQRSIAAVA